jgi:acyl carrier protein
MDDVVGRARSVVMTEIRDALALLGIPESEVDADFDLLHSGAVDSMRFLELLGTLERELGFEINLQEFEIEGVTRLGGLMRAVQASAAHASN